MKIAYCSDLHLEFKTAEIKNTDNADVLILAGDIFTTYELLPYDDESYFFHKSIRIHTFLQNCCKEFNHVIMTCGNHESYNFDIDKTTSEIKRHLKYLKNFYILDNSCITVEDVIFVGGTMWSDMNGEDLETLHDIKSLMNDFRIIKKGKYRHTPEDALDSFKETTDYIDLMSTIHKDEKIVVVTHHAPSFRSVDPIYKDSTIMNGGFCSNLENFIKDRKNIKVCVHGHLHYKSDYMIGECNVLCNPRGYIGKEKCADNFKLEYFEI